MRLDIHPVQAKILLSLLYVSPTTFSQLNTENLSTDHFSFHINHLLEKQLITKNLSQYVLTEKGKKYANTLNKDNLQRHEQGKVAVLIIAKRNNTYLIQKRKKQPYKNTYAFIAGKITRGENIYYAAKRQLQEETGLQGNTKLIGIIHKLDLDKKTTLLEDKYYFVFLADNCSGNLLSSSPDGTHSWMSISQIKKLSPLLSGAKDAIEFLKKRHITFVEKSFIISDF